MKFLTSRLTTIVLTAMALVALGLTPAQAAPVHRAQAVAVHMSAPAIAPAMASAATSAPPSTSPSVFSCNGKDDIDHWTACTKCASGYACAFMCCYNNANYFFRFYTGGTYSLYYWHNSENFYNHQTGGWTVKTYGQSGNLLHCYAPRTAYYTVDWDPVWSLKLSAQAC